VKYGIRLSDTPATPPYRTLPNRAPRVPNTCWWSRGRVEKVWADAWISRVEHEFTYLVNGQRWLLLSESGWRRPNRLRVGAVSNVRQKLQVRHRSQEGRKREMLRRIPKCSCSWRSCSLRGQRRPGFGRAVGVVLSRDERLPFPPGGGGCRFDQKTSQCVKYELQWNLLNLPYRMGPGSVHLASTMDASNL